MQSLFFLSKRAVALSVLLLNSLIISELNSLERVSLNRLTPELSEEMVEVRGFTYRTERGEWVLAGQPNLKSCCTGSENRRSEQIVLRGWGGEEPSRRAVKVRGLLKCEGGGYSLLVE